MVDTGENKLATEEYEVERIVGDKYDKQRKTRMWFVRWKDYGPQFDTWQTHKDLRNVPEMLKEYLRNKAKQFHIGRNTERPTLQAHTSVFNTKMDFDLRYPDRLRPVYLWSLRGDQHWCSVGTSSDFVPPDANEFIGNAQAYPNRRNARVGMVTGMGQPGGFPGRVLNMPASLGSPDPINSDNPWTTHRPTRTRDHPYARGLLCSLEHKGFPARYDPMLHWLGWSPVSRNTEVEDETTALVFEANPVSLREHYYDVQRSGGSDDGDSPAFAGQLGDLPEQLKENDLSGLHYHDYEARKVANDARRVVLDAESYTGRFVRLNPGFLSEYTVLAATQPIGPLDLRSLPHYLDWERDLSRYDIYFQDLFAGRRGGTLRDFRPDWEYLILDFSHYGARPVESRLARRAYTERFKGMVKHSPKGTTCTFFRQNPLGIDEPPSVRIPCLDHLYSLDDFGPEAKGYGKSELEYFHEPNPCEEPITRTMECESGRLNHRNLKKELLDLGPRGEPLSLQERMEGADLRRARSPMSPTHRSEGGASTWESRWALGMAGCRRSSRRSRTLSSERSTRSGDLESDRSFEEEYGGIAEDAEIAQAEEAPQIPETVQSTPFDNPPGPLDSYRPHFQTRDEATQAIESWSSGITELKLPVSWDNNGWWNHDWLSKAILICDIFNMAICYGAAFELYIKQTDTRKVGMPTQVTSLLQFTLHATYTVGFTDIFLDFGAGGVTCYGRYLSQILALLNRPHAVAFIAAGGILSFIAQLYNEELVCRFLEGPSVQVTQFSKGKSFWMNNGEDDESWTTDQVSEGEISILLGHIVTGNPTTDTFLWPHPSWLENDSDHFHGAWTPVAYSFLKNLEQNIVQKKQYVW
ncbi:hypothetical protein B0H13DRAFT_1914904 [Mycena leptocephala]|nr:hypothetical protein B0H13DRAFT_1914904 [Mycena leptocephala]